MNIVSFDMRKCTSCNECIRACPTGALDRFEAGLTHDSLNCSWCESCMDVCDNNAIKVEVN